MMAAAARKAEEAAGRAQLYAADPIEGTSRGTQSERTLAERHSDLPLDYPPDLAARINAAMARTFAQMHSEGEQLITDLQRFRRMISERSRSTVDFIQDHADFVHDLRVKMEEERMEEERMEKEKAGEREKEERENEEKEMEEG
ncbi:hypothetical protein MTO96_003969 [Rhipicephalus appendiculatus]